MDLPSLPDLAVALVIMFVGATVFSTVGFGIGLATIPVLLLVLDPQTVVVTVNTAAPLLFLLFLLILWQTREFLDVREMVPISLAGLAGVPIGVMLLSVVGAATLRIGIATLVILTACAVAFNLRSPIPRTRLTGPAVGFLGEVFINSTGIGGPMLVLHLLARNWPRHAIRAALSFYFLAIGITGLAGYAVAGLYTTERISLVLAVLVPVVLGYAMASRLLRGMDETVFRRAVVVVIITTSVAVLGRELVGVL